MKDEGIYQCTANNGIEMIHQAASLIVGGLLCNIIIKFILIIFNNFQLIFVNDIIVVIIISYLKI